MEPEMKRKMLVGLGICAVTQGAFASGSVTLYGVIDAGVNYISNDVGHSNVTLSSGVIQGSRWGFKGVEDLGGGLSAIFQLENGFNVTNGTLLQSGRMFGRQAWVGLGSKTFGTVTLGRQYDSMVEYIQPLTGIPYTGLAHPLDNDNLSNGFRVNNALKYSSPEFSGFKFGGLYGFSNNPGSSTGPSGFSNNRAWSVGGSYSGGPAVLAAAYTHLNFPNSTDNGGASGAVTGEFPVPPMLTGQQIARKDSWAAAGTYTLGPTRVGLVYSHSRFDTNVDVLSFDNYELNVSYQMYPDLQLTGRYTFTDGHQHSNDLRPKYQQFELVADYLLSKRTDIYLLGALQKANGSGVTAVLGPDTFGPGGKSSPDGSTTQSQVLVRLGMRVKF
jgi:GBP family porin